MSNLQFTWCGAIFRWEEKEKIFKLHGSTWNATTWPSGLAWRGKIVFGEVGAMHLPVGQGSTPQEALADSLKQGKELLANLESKL
jgi:hypothetical protein